MNKDESVGEKRGGGERRKSGEKKREENRGEEVDLRYDDGNSYLNNSSFDHSSYPLHSNTVAPLHKPSHDVVNSTSKKNKILNLSAGIYIILFCYTTLYIYIYLYNIIIIIIILIIIITIIIIIMIIIIIIL